MNYVQIAFLLGMLFGGFNVIFGYCLEPYITKILKIKEREINSEDGH